jgi:hypothetical protein
MGADTVADFVWFGDGDLDELVLGLLVQIEIILVR